MTYGTTRLNNLLFPVIIFIVLTLICYINTFNVPFVFDDIPNIVENPAIHIHSLSIEDLKKAGFDSLMPSRPLANISFALNYYFGKLDVTGYHLVNTIIHFLNGILVYLLAVFIIKKLQMSNQHTPSRIDDTGISFIALIAACLFISHPVQIQSVTYVVQRMNSLSTLFYLGALLAYLYGRTTTENLKKYTLYGIFLICFVLALASKEIAAMLPVTVLLMEWLLFNHSIKELFNKNRGKIFIFLGMVFFIALFLLGNNPVERILSDYAHRNFTLSERLLTELRIVIFYISLIVLPLPSRLNLIHDIDLSRSLFDPITTLISLLFIIGVLLLAIKVSSKYRIVSLCIFWFFLHLVIESSIIGLELIFEHRLYLPMVGVCILFSYLLYIYFKNKFYKLLCIVLVVSLSAGTYARNTAWQTEETLWTDVINKNPSSYRAYYNLANERSKYGELEEAVYLYQKALSINSGYSKAHNNLGIAMQKLGYTNMAMFHYKIAMEINPADHSPNYNLAIALNSLGNTGEAIIEYKNAIEKNPYYAESYYNLANIYEQQNNLNEAKYYYEETIKLSPQHILALNNLGILLAEEGNLAEAESKFQQVIQIDPEYYGAYINLMMLNQSRGDMNRACQIYIQYNLEALAPELVPEEIKSRC